MQHVKNWTPMIYYACPKTLSASVHKRVTQTEATISLTTFCIISEFSSQFRGLLNLEIQCRIYKGPPIIIILSRINPIPRIDTYSLRSITILSSHIRLGLPKGFFPVGLPVKILKALLPSSILTTCPAHLNLLKSKQSYSSKSAN